MAIQIPDAVRELLDAPNYVHLSAHAWLRPRARLTSCALDTRSYRRARAVR